MVDAGFIGNLIIALNSHSHNAISLVAALRSAR